MKTKRRSILVSCLPKAGQENPYQILMMQGLAANSDFIVKYGMDNKWFGLLATWILQRPNYIHLDWETKYYYRKYLLLTIISVPIFIMQLVAIKYISKTKIVWTAHNLMPHDAKHLFVHTFCRRVLARYVSWVRVFSESSQLKFADVLGISVSKIQVVPEGDYTQFYPNEIPREVARDHLQIPKNKRVLLYFGMIRPYKGLLDLVKIVNDLSLPETILIIAGYPRDIEYFERVRCEAALNSNIQIYAKYIEPTDVQLYFNSSDVVVLPFQNIENSGSVILAMGFKKPVVARRDGAVLQRLKNQSGLLFTNDLKEVLRNLSKATPDQLRRIGEDNSAAVQEAKWSDFQKCFC